MDPNKYTNIIDFAHEEVVANNPQARSQDMSGAQYLAAIEPESGDFATQVVDWAFIPMFTSIDGQQEDKGKSSRMRTYKACYLDTYALKN